MVGWLIRFVHKRDKPIESVVMAISRREVLRKAPTDAMESIQERFKDRDSSISGRSYFLDATAEKMEAGTIRGAGMVALRPSRRNSRKRPISKDLKRYAKSHYRLLGRDGAGTRAVEFRSDEATVMTAGVLLNGIRWKEKDCCDFQVRVARDKPDQAADHAVGSVHTFHVVSMVGYGQQVFVKIYVHPVVRRLRGLYVVHNHKNS